jgi:hypothetical protein
MGEGVPSESCKMSRTRDRNTFSAEENLQKLNEWQDKCSSINRGIFSLLEG